MIPTCRLKVKNHPLVAYSIHFFLFALHNRAMLLRQRTHMHARTHTRTHTQTHTHIHKELHTLSLSPSLCMSLSPKVVPLPKTNDSSDPSNYRPISSLPVIPKRLERHIHKHLLQYKLIHQYQSGFRLNHSCHTALTRLCYGWLSAINCSETVGTLFLDFMKAFDLHERLSLYAKDSSPLTFFILILQTGHNFFFLTTSHLQRDW